jgi:hypothetical protein
MAWHDAFVEKTAASALRVAHHHGPAPRLSLRLPIGQTGGGRVVQIFMKGRSVQSALQHQMAFVVLSICQVQQQHPQTGGWQGVSSSEEKQNGCSCTPRLRLNRNLPSLP